MKKLPEYITEKLLIFPSQVNEKLVINKNTKIFTANEDFYEKFKDFFTRKDWWKSENIDSICNLLVKDKDAIPYLKEFFGDDSLNFKYVDKRSDFPLWEDMLDFIKSNDDMEFVYNNSPIYDNDQYVLCLFETEELKIFIWGWTPIKAGHLGHIAYQKKQ